MEASQHQTSRLVLLPTELVEKIVSHLQEEDILSIRLTSAEIAAKSTKAFAQVCVNHLDSRLCVLDGPKFDRTLSFLVDKRYLSFVKRVSLYGHCDESTPTNISGVEMARILSQLPNLENFGIQLFYGSTQLEFLDNLLPSLQLPKLKRFHAIEVEVPTSNLIQFLTNHRDTINDLTLCDTILLEGVWPSVLNAIAGMEKSSGCSVTIATPLEKKMAISFVPNNNDLDIDFVCVGLHEENYTDQRYHQYSFSSKADQPDGITRAVACMKRAYTLLPQELDD